MINIKVFFALKFYISGWYCIYLNLDVSSGVWHNISNDAEVEMAHKVPGHRPTSTTYRVSPSMKLP